MAVLRIDEPFANMEFHTLDIPRAQGLVVYREAYDPKVTYSRVCTGLSQNGLIEFLKRSNDEQHLEGVDRTRPASPDIEFGLSELGREYAVFGDQFERDDNAYIEVLTDTKLCIPGQREYREGDFWRRDVYRHDGERWVKVAEGQKIPGSGVILNVDKALGIPNETIRSYEPPERLNHWRFDHNLDEVAVSRHGQMGDELVGRFNLYAYWVSRCPNSRLGFRPVRGPMPTYRKLS